MEKKRQTLLTLPFLPCKHKFNHILDPKDGRVCLNASNGPDLNTGDNTIFINCQSKRSKKHTQADFFLSWFDLNLLFLCPVPSVLFLIPNLRVSKYTFKFVGPPLNPG